MKKSKRVNEVVLIRIFAILSVVIGHSIIVYTDEWIWYNMQIQSNFLDNLKAVINIYQMPLFISLSGYLFYYLKIECGKYTNLVPFLQSKFKRLLLPFIVVGTFFMIPLRLLGDYPAYEGNSFLNIFFFDLIIGRDAGNLWFLPVLFIIFIAFFFYATYLFKKNNVSTFFHFIVFFIISLVSYKTPSTFFVNEAMYYAIFFFFGFQLFRFREQLLEHQLFILITSGILQFSNLAFLSISIPDNIIFTAISVCVGIVASLFSCLFFYTLFLIINEANQKLATSKTVSFIDKNSFGLYLFHSSLLYPILNFATQLTINPILFSVLMFITISFISLLITVILSHLKHLKFIIGK